MLINRNITRKTKGERGVVIRVIRSEPNADKNGNN
jgi:hypothetical protein